MQQVQNMKWIFRLIFSGFLCGLSGVIPACSESADPGRRPALPPVPATEMNKKMDTITLGAGCFWCVETLFRELKGVQKVVSGYSGGHKANPTYKEVCEGNTGHAEVVQVTFDPSAIALEQILEVFFKTHDPTTLNRQGNDSGTQYRSAVFYHSAAQKEAALRIIAALNAEGVWPDPVVTEVTAYSDFWPAEEYHQDYYNRNGEQPYCRFVIQPKVEKFRKVFKESLR
jgi:peptide-methionine (S)-S-oxide reductase